MEPPKTTIKLRPAGSSSPHPMQGANSTIRLQAPVGHQSQMVPPPQAPTMRIVSPPSPPSIDTATSMLSAVEFQRPPMGQTPSVGGIHLQGVTRTASNIVPAHTLNLQKTATGSRPLGSPMNNTSSRAIQINQTASRPLGAPMVGTGTTALPRVTVTNGAATMKFEQGAENSAGQASHSSTTMRVNTPATGKKTLSLKRDGGHATPVAQNVSEGAPTIKFNTPGGTGDSEHVDFADASVFQEPFKRMKREKPDQLPFTGSFYYTGFGLIAALIITFLSLGIFTQLINLWQDDPIVLSEAEYKTPSTMAPFDAVFSGTIE